MITFEAQRVESYIHDARATGHRHDDTSTIRADTMRCGWRRGGRRVDIVKCGRGETQAEMAERGGGGGGLHAQRERGPYTVNNGCVRVGSSRTTSTSRGASTTRWCSQ